MIETTVESIRVSLVTQHRVVILKEVDGDRHLPIWIGAYEAEAIAMELQGVTPTRPLPYDLMRTILGDLGATVERIIIADLSQEVFFARVIVDHSGRTHEIDSRPSDAIALAVRTGARIMVDDAVIERAGVTLNGEEEEGHFAASAGERGGSPREGGEAGASGQDDERLSVFRDFINSLDLDDFDRKRSSS
jgi:bifunctional DNase/RNase